MAQATIYTGGEIVTLAPGEPVAEALASVGDRIVAVGQPVLFVNRDSIFQATFSYSRPNTFECRAFAPGQICMVTFGEPGEVRIYSPLDQHMRAVVFVAPGRLHAVPDSRGEFRIDAVPPGRYRATLWMERREASSRNVVVMPGAAGRADFTLPRPLSTGGPSAAGSAAPE